MRQTLNYTEGYWWYRKSDNNFFPCVFLANWDSADNYQQVTDEWKIQWEQDHEDVELTDAQALDIITNGYETE